MRNIFLPLYILSVFFLKMTSLNHRFNSSFAKVRVSLIPATLPSYFFYPLFAFLSIG